MARTKKEPEQLVQEENKYGKPRIFPEICPQGNYWYVAMEWIEDGLPQIRYMSGRLYSRKEAEAFVKFLDKRKSKLGYYVNKETF